MKHVMQKLGMAVALTALVAIGSGCARTVKAQTGQSFAIQDEEVVGGQPPRANTIYGMARLMRAQGKSDQAELALIGLLKEYPNFSPTYNDLAEIRMEKGQLQQALHYLEQGLEVAPNDPVLLNNAGVCALLKHDYEGALRHFKKAASLAPYESRYQANVALALGLNGDVESSKAMYRQIVSEKDAEFNAALIQQLMAPTEAGTPTD